MALAKISFNRGRGGLGRVRAGSTHISSLVFYGASPLGWPTSGVKAIYSITEAENAGITEAAFPVEHYHISEFFRTAGNAELWVGLFPVPGNGIYDFTELDAVYAESQGEVRQYGVFVTDDFATGLVNALHAQLLKFDQEAPAVGVLTADISAVADLTTLEDQAGLNDKVYIDIAQSGKGRGADLFDIEDYTIGTTGATLGTIAAAAVSDGIDAVGQFNVAGNELDVIAFGNGELLSTKKSAFLDGLDDKCYGFLVKYKGTTGSYFSSSKTASVAGDYDTLEKNRTIGEAIRLVRGALLPKLNSKVLLNADGSLRETDIASFQELGNAALDVLINNRDLSFGQVIIDPSQDILGTDKLVITIQLIPVGKARTIEVNIGFTKQIS